MKSNHVKQLNKKEQSINKDQSTDKVLLKNDELSKEKNVMNPSYIKFDSPWGEGLLKIDATGAINGFWFYEQKYFPKINAELIIDAPDFLIDSDQSTQQMKESFVLFQSEIEAYARGEISAFNSELAPEGTDFPKLVWALLLEVP